MERIMIHCSESGIGPQAYQAGKKYPADEVLAHEFQRENPFEISVWGHCIGGLEMVGCDQYLGMFDYAVMEA
ncbi:hypothetical protein RO179_000789 [Escherichia coli]|nr:hypothetical protein [Escherichia coli]